MVDFDKIRKFCVVYLTRNFYEMFTKCIYKYSKADYDDVLVLNVDIGSSEIELENGKNICNKLDIHFVNSESDVYHRMQAGLLAAEQYLTDNNIDVDWLVYFLHDIVPIQQDFWNKIDKCIDSIDNINDRVGMFGGNTVNYPAEINKSNIFESTYDFALKMLKEGTDKDIRRAGTVSGRGNLVEGILNFPYAGWYQQLPQSYYETDYYVVEVPAWMCVGFNRKLIKKYIEIDENLVFDLWADDVGHQLMLKSNCVNITFNDLMTASDQQKWVEEAEVVSDRSWMDHRGKGGSIWEKKYGWEFGYRNKRLREQFNSLFPRYEGTLFEKFFNMNISDGPKRIEDFE